MNFVTYANVESTDYGHLVKRMLEPSIIYFNKGFPSDATKARRWYKNMRRDMVACRDILEIYHAYRIFNEILDTNCSETVYYDNDLVICSYISPRHLSFLPTYRIHLVMTHLGHVNMPIIYRSPFKDTRLYRRITTQGINMEKHKDECYYGDPIRILLEASRSTTPLRRLPLDLIRMIDIFLP